MLREQPILNILVINLLLGTVWHYAVFFLCVFIDTKHFDERKRMYLPEKWERGGKFYTNTLKIQKWKDALPQHIGKDGFSKDHLDDVSVDYLNEFIMETCRGEWNHRLNCFFAVVLIVINDFWVALFLTICLLVGNIPFVIIQRYNRFRLQKLRDYMIRKQEREIRTES